MGLSQVRALYGFYVKNGKCQIARGNSQELMPCISKVVVNMEIINTVAQSVVIAGFLTGAFSYIVLTPLNKSIEGLRTIVQELKDELRYSEQRRHELQERVAKVEASAASAHHRLDRIDDVLGGVHQ